MGAHGGGRGYHDFIREILFVVVEFKAADLIVITEARQCQRYPLWARRCECDEVAHSHIHISAND